MGKSLFMSLLIIVSKALGMDEISDFSTRSIWSSADVMPAEDVKSFPLTLESKGLTWL